MPDTRYSSASKRYGGSYEAPKEIPEEGIVPPKFIMKEKIADMLRYGMPIVNSFPRRSRQMADMMRQSMLEMYKLATQLEKAYYKKTTLQTLDVELATLREFVVLASDKDFCGEKYAPPLTLHQRDVWSRMNDEIGRIVGGYIKAVNTKQVSRPQGF